MDLLELFKPILQLITRVLGMSVTIADHRITLGSLFVFCGLLGIVLRFLKGLSE